MKEYNSIPFSITSDYDSIDNEEVFLKLLKVLMAYAHKLTGDSSLRLAKNREEMAYDFAMETITLYKENPSKFDPTKNPDLVKYLKWYILRQLISNQKKLKGQENELLFENEDPIGIAVMNAFVSENGIYDTIDLNNTVKLILDEIDDDKILRELFIFRYIDDYSRAEIIKKAEISEGEYNNRIRRLDTIRKRVIKAQQTEIRV